MVYKGVDLIRFEKLHFSLQNFIFQHCFPVAYYLKTFTEKRKTKIVLKASYYVYSRRRVYVQSIILLYYYY